MKKIIFTLNIVIATVIFVFLNLNSSAQYVKLFDFTGTSNGNAPSSDLYYDGTFMYGTTSTGGANSKGVIFKIMPDGTGYSKLLDFSGTANGSTPLGSLISDGTFLYGMTKLGGAHNYGVIFKIMPDGTGYSKLLDFTFATTGSDPEGSLYFDGTFLYGMTYSGGVGGFGTLFKIMPDGTGYSKLLDFDRSTNGSFPEGKLISDGTFLYGTTTGGGANDMGIIFKIKPDGSGYADILDFAGMANGNIPQGSLITDGTYLYGLTTFGGANNSGTVFKVKPDGTGYSKLLDFAGFPNGGNPWGSLISDGTYLYGMTRNGGPIGSNGTIFKIKTDGTGYSDLYDFINVNDGIFPQGSFISVAGSMYATAINGGTNNFGVIFKYNVATGISQLTDPESQLSVYPNPTCGKFIIENKGEIQTKFEVDIFNTIGEKIYSESLFITNKSSEIDLTEFPKGIYFARIKEGIKVHCRRIVLQ